MNSLAQYVVVIRHGQTIPNLLVQHFTENHFYEVTGSDETVGLTELGISQIKEAGFFLALLRRRVKVARLYCSQFFRTRSSAEVIQSILPGHPQIVEDPRIAKRHYGDFWNITYSGVKALYPEEYEKFLQQGGYFYRPPNGENYADLKVRVNDYIHEVIDGTEDSIAIATHSAVALVLEQLLLGEMTDAELVQRYDAMSVSNASVVIYKRVAGGRLVFGRRIDFVGWLKRLLGMRHASWVRWASFTPPCAATESSSSDNRCAQCTSADSIIDKEDRVA